MRRCSTRADAIVQGLGAVGGVIGDGVTEQMGLRMDAKAELG